MTPSPTRAKVAETATRARVKRWNFKIKTSVGSTPVRKVSKRSLFTFCALGSVKWAASAQYINSRRVLVFV